MAKYLLTVNYTPDAMKGVLAEGGTSRKAAVEALAASIGATVESVHFSFGHSDIVIIVDDADDAGIAAVAMTVMASGVAQSYLAIPLLTAAQVDDAAKMSPAYRPPGS